MEIKTILVPTDFSEDAARALETATQIARVFDARLVLLHAYTLDIPIASGAYSGGVILPDGFYVEYRNQATHHVTRVAKETESKAGIKVEGVAIQQPPWQAIVDQAEQLPADLVVMGTRGLTGLKHVALGSTAERVLRKASCPVLTVKANQ